MDFLFCCYYYFFLMPWTNFGTSQVMKFVVKFYYLPPRAMREAGDIETALSVRPSVHKHLQLLLWNHTHNFDETWQQPSSPGMYQSLFTALTKNPSPKRVLRGVALQKRYLVMKVVVKIHQNCMYSLRKKQISILGGQPPYLVDPFNYRRFWCGR